DLDVLAGDEHGGVADVALRHRDGGFAGRFIHVRRPGRVMRTHTRELDAVQHVDGLVPDRLERRDRSVELHAYLRVLDRERQRGVAHPDELRAQQRGTVVGDPSPRPRVVAHESDPLDRRLLEYEPRRLASRIQRRYRLRYWRLEQERPDALLGARGD